MKMTRHTLKKMEAILEELNYELIYEKGNFKSGYCLVESKNIAVINKFFDVEARINCIVEILDTIEFEEEILSKGSRKFLQQISYSEPELPLAEAVDHSQS